MFIYLAYKDAPELSTARRKGSSSSGSESDLAIEKYLLVNPDCYVRIMLEYIRKACKLAATTQFDLCEDNGTLKCLFSFPTYAYVNSLFEHKRTYYLVVFKVETDRSITVIPQLNHDNRMFLDLQAKVQRVLFNKHTMTDAVSPSTLATSKIGFAPLKKK